MSRENLSKWDLGVYSSQNVLLLLYIIVLCALYALFHLNPYNNPKIDITNGFIIDMGKLRLPRDYIFGHIKSRFCNLLIRKSDFKTNVLSGRYILL